MNQVMTLLRQLEAHVQEEIGAQSRVLAALEAQGEALRSHESARIVAATSTLDAEIMAQARRTERRNELLSALAAAWSLPTGTLTLGSIVQASATRAAGSRASARSSPRPWATSRARAGATASSRGCTSA